MKLRCPACHEWIDCGLRRVRQHLNSHIRECDPAMYRRQQAVKREIEGVTA